jgi:hypothetical protein
MRLVHRNRNSRRGSGLRIAISQAEITADLRYPADPHQARPVATGARRSGR